MNSLNHGRDSVYITIATIQKARVCKVFARIPIHKEAKNYLAKDAGRV